MKRFGIYLILLMITILALTISAGGPKEPAHPTQLHISYVKSPFNLQVMVMKERQMLEKAFAPEGIKIKWHAINSGAKQAQAMAAGSLDIASVMNTASVIIANSAGNEIDIIDIVSRPAQTFAVMVMNDGPQNVKDLSHCVVAGPKGTVLHQMLAAIQAKENLEEVQLVSMSLPQSQAALVSKKVDAALLAGSLIIKTQNAGGRVLTTSEGYVTPLLVSASPRRFAQNHPDIIDRFTLVQQKAYTFIHNHLSQAIAIGARAQNLDSEDAKDLYNRSGMASGFTQDDLSNIACDINFLKNLDLIKNDMAVSEILGKNLNGY
jgi:NitT/TauT family transport system substrate-binding protein/sulfonate transport system substrate-binding protein